MVRNKPKIIQNWFNYQSNSIVCKEYISIGLTIILLLSMFSTLFAPILSAGGILGSPVTTEKKEIETITPSSEKETVDKTNTETSTDTKIDIPSEKETASEETKEEESSTGSEVKATPEESTETSSDPEEEIDQSETSEPSSPASTDDSKDTTSTTSLTSQKTVSITKVDSTSEIKSYDSTNSKDLLSSNTEIYSTEEETNNSSGIIANTNIKYSNNFILEEKNGSSDNNTVKQFSSSIGNISMDQTITISTPEITVNEISLAKPKTTIEKVEFTAKSSKNNVEFSVKNLKEKPEEVKVDMSLSNVSEVYEYLDIKLTSDEEYIGESGIKSMNFTFTVNKSWVEHNDIDKDTVTMMRYHNDAWQELNTTYLNETDDKMTFKAITPGLSIFAVVGDKVVEDSDEIIVESTLPWWMPAMVIFASTATLGLVLFKKRFVYNP